MCEGIRIIITGRHLNGRRGTIISSYHSPLGPSWLVELDGGSVVAVRAVDLCEA